jgi:DNA-binding GntR family transcriptional regulator
MQAYKSKVDIVYEYLLDEIAKGVYKAHDRLVISQIARQMNVSDIPVREAIRRLESQGFVSINANQGAVVVGIDNDNLTSVFMIKGILEGFATRLSIDYLTQSDLKHLRSINAQIQKAGEQLNAKKYSELNIKFHLEIYKKIPQKLLYDMICDLWKKWTITSSVFGVVPARMQESHLEHEEIIRLIEAKAYDQVESYVRAHKIKSGTKWAEHVEVDFTPFGRHD